MNINNSRYLGGVGVFGVLTLLWVASLAAQTFSPYSDFQTMTLQQLETLQVQLSPQGPQDDSLFPVTFTSTVNSIDLTKFSSFRCPGVIYSTVAGSTFKATVQELKAIIDNVATR